jgi:hypothetical protein
VLQYLHPVQTRPGFGSIVLAPKSSTVFLLKKPA